MNCFNHNERSACGICRVCCRGLCDACSADLGHSLACRGEHEEAAEAIHALNLRSTKFLKVTRRSVFIAPLFYGVAGAAFLSEGLRQQDQWNLATMLGSAFVVFAVAVLVTGIRAYGGRTSGGRT